MENIFFSLLYLIGWVILMGILSDDFLKIVRALGVSELKHPLFYNCAAGIRFEIGGDEGVYLINECSEEYTASPAYISAAFERAKTIYTGLPNKPNLIRIDGYPDENHEKNVIRTICHAGNLPLPHEQVVKPVKRDEDGKTISQLQLYWDLERITFTPDRLLREIIKADIGGYNAFVSNVYFADTHNGIIFHLYDDRGADLVAADRERLRCVYEKYNRWILDDDREKIDAIFV